VAPLRRPQKSYLNQEFDGGYRNDPEEWPTIQDVMIDAMIRLEKAIGPFVPQLRQVQPGSAGPESGASTDRSQTVGPSGVDAR
jgi:hypothetical protein